MKKLFCDFAENNVLQKRIDVKDKELQKASKLMKIPGFGVRFIS